MSKLAIRGHATRGKEVIEILEMLGGRNDRNYIGELSNYIYTINEQGIIDWYLHYNSFQFDIFTVEEFLKKFPYKVGDKVQHKGATSCGSVFEVEKMKWVGDHVEYTVKRLWYYNGYSTVTAEDLQPYEETMEERKYADLRLDVDQDDKLATEATIDGDKITPPKNYLIGKITKVDNGMLVEFVKKQPQLPKTYAECCKTLHIPVNGDIVYAGNWNDGGEYLDKHLDIIRKFQQLLICRDAYWKIAGEQMSLGKPWEPYASDEGKTYSLFYNRHEDTIDKCSGLYESNAVLDFPTEEMRDAFFDYFKDLIELCKELL